MIDNIEHNVVNAGDYTQEAVVKLTQAVEYQSKSRKVLKNR